MRSSIKALPGPLIRWHCSTVIIGMNLGRVITEDELGRLLKRLDGKRYGAYKRLKGSVFDYAFAEATFTRIQGDPYAPPSVLEITIPHHAHNFPAEFFDEKESTAFLDYVARELYEKSLRMRRKSGTGNSGYIGCPRPGPWILRRSCAEISGRNLVLRIFVGLPARGRRILGKIASEKMALRERVCSIHQGWKHPSKGVKLFSKAFNARGSFQIA